MLCIIHINKKIIEYVMLLEIPICYYTSRPKIKNHCCSPCQSCGFTMYKYGIEDRSEKKREGGLKKKATRLRIGDDAYNNIFIIIRENFCTSCGTKLV